MKLDVGMLTYDLKSIPVYARKVEALGYDDVRITTDLTGVERVVEGRRRRA